MEEEEGEEKGEEKEEEGGVCGGGVDKGRKAGRWHRPPNCSSELSALSTSSVVSLLRFEYLTN